MLKKLKSSAVKRISGLLSQRRNSGSGKGDYPDNAWPPVSHGGLSVQT
ncbi:hypothetical protein FQN60_018197 [Etheostoma spectabile]|uniref:Uncharacterized protein n=1 Tax=Etheostoma spectabile TaxID=54343 RepID=A0A5J5DHC6_9PERO|nr:hypothetical protein FQN60_018197 [Etheostoma spectabile]